MRWRGGRARAARGAAAQFGSGRGDAVRQHHRQAFRQRRLSGMPAPRRAAIDIAAVRRRQAEATRCAERIGVGFTIFCEQARARHVGLFRLGHPDGAGLRAGSRAADPGWRARAPRRHPVARAGTGNHSGPGRARGAGHRQSLRSGVVHGDTALTPYSTGTWGSRCMVMAGGAVVPPAASSPGASRASARICCRTRPMRCVSATAW